MRRGFYQQIKYIIAIEEDQSPKEYMTEFDSRQRWS